jgi:hypothetical protein
MRLRLENKPFGYPSKFPASSQPVIAADIQRGKKLTYDGALALLTLVASFAGA